MLRTSFCLFKSTEFLDRLHFHSPREILSVFEMKQWDVVHVSNYKFNVRCLFIEIETLFYSDVHIHTIDFIPIPFRFSSCSRNTE